MSYNSLLPALVPGVIVLAVLSVGAGFALAWNSDPRIRLIVRRFWIFAAVLVIGCVAVFWVSTVMVQGPKRVIVDRSLQEKQQDELRKRIHGGGH